ncbi:MAG: hypothetical protein GY696_14550 [Gammaproteobacteria bacterium]|nr:hypothetical protein [Gammaproteobacteria bacterium]
MTVSVFALLGSESLVSVVGSLRRRIDFWVNAGASDFVQSVIRNGYRIPFLRPPPKFHFPNNHSANDHSEFVEAEIVSLFIKRCVLEVPSKPHVISPLSVAQSSAGKLRLILDLSALNFFLPKMQIKFEGIETVLPFLTPGSFAMKFDFKSGYHHIEIAPEHRTFLGFSWKFAGKLRYFVFAVLPFGLSLGPYIFTKVMRTPVLYWRKKGFKIVLYMDDGILVVEYYSDGILISREIRGDLHNFGIVTVPEKCQWEPKQTVDWLGVFFNLRDFFISIPDNRVAKCFESASLFSDRRSSVSARQIAGLCGRLISMKIVLGPIVQLKTRRLYEFVQSRHSWDSLSRLEAPQREELRFWRNSLHLLNKRGLSLTSKAEILEPRILLCTDASATGAGGALGNANCFSVATTTWEPDEADMSSTWRELKTVLFCLQSFGSRLSNKYVKLHTDNQGTVSVIAKGSPKQHMQLVAEQIFSTCLSLGCVLEPVWIPRNQNELADSISQIVDLDDWSVRKPIFAVIDQRFGPHSIDRFADHKNCQLSRFNSKYFVPGTAGVDAFAYDWSDDNNWLVPPLFLVPRVIKHLRESRARGTLIIPKWPSQCYWPLLVDSSGAFRFFVADSIAFPARTKVFEPSSQPSSVFNQPHFPSPVLALRIQFT